MTTYFTYKKMIEDRKEDLDENTFYVMLLCMFVAALIDLTIGIIATVLIINI